MRGIDRQKTKPSTPYPVQVREILIIFFFFLFHVSLQSAIIFPIIQYIIKISNESTYN